MESRQRDQPRPVPVWRVRPLGTGCTVPEKAAGTRRRSPLVVRRGRVQQGRVDGRVQLALRQPDVGGDAKLPIAGVALGAVPLVAVTADRLARPSVTARKQATEYGTGNRLEGRLDEGEGVEAAESSRRFATQTPVASTPLTTAIRVFPHLWTP